MAEPILSLYEQLGGTGSELGFPTQPETDASELDGERSQQFEGGRIVVADGRASVAP